MKEKIGMQKLIELLNEFENEERNHQTSRTYEYNGFHYIDYGMIYSEFLMISKKYGFIKWLVENDKIDFSNIKRIIKDYEVEDNEVLEYYDLDFATKKETLLMLLSISDTPIEDLVSYLI